MDSNRTGTTSTPGVLYYSSTTIVLEYSSRVDLSMIVPIPVGDSVKLGLFVIMIPLPRSAHVIKWRRYDVHACYR